jgi:tetratricopeptide (TPR) repeat protein
MRSFVCLLTILLSLSGAVVAQEKRLEIKEPETAAEYSTRGLERLRKGDLDGAIADYDKALLLKPNDVRALINRGGARARRGDLGGSLADFELAISIEPNNAAALPFPNLGVLVNSTRLEVTQLKEM